MPGTLYDDWKARRERLARMPGRVGDHQAVEMRVLDFLLQRYRAAPESTRPARFPLPASLFVNHRAITVFHHLGQGMIPKITNRQEALAHVRASSITCSPLLPMNLQNRMRALQILPSRCRSIGRNRCGCSCATATRWSAFRPLCSSVRLAT